MVKMAFDELSTAKNSPAEVSFGKISSNCLGLNEMSKFQYFACKCGYGLNQHGSDGINSGHSALS
jgi:hypothetical protein